MTDTNKTANEFLDRFAKDECADVANGMVCRGCAIAAIEAAIEKVRQDLAGALGRLVVAQNERDEAKAQWQEECRASSSSRLDLAHNAAALEWIEQNVLSGVQIVARAVYETSRNGAAKRTK